MPNDSAREELQTKCQEGIAWACTQLQFLNKPKITAESQGEAVQEFAEGGEVLGEGTGTSDSINAKLSDGEFIFTAKAVQQIGVERLEALMAKAETDFDQADSTGQQMQQLFPKV